MANGTPVTLIRIVRLGKNCIVQFFSDFRLACDSIACRNSAVKKENIEKNWAEKSDEDEKVGQKLVKVPHLSSDETCMHIKII